ncbi:MAG: STAS domain-containing protein [Candidatus Aureabacteria bacterium]|nr:STAS domain-containing protein [Candidatus Auribacterota bacterium]
MSLTVTVTEKEGGFIMIAPVGSIDATTCAVLEEHVDSALRKLPKVVVFEMHGVEYISSAGIRVILKAQKALKAAGGEMTMVRLQPKVKKVFDIIRALPSQQIFASVEELDAYLDNIQKGV